MSIQYYSAHQIIAESDLRPFMNIFTVFWKTAAINGCECISIGKRIAFPPSSRKVLLRELNKYAADHPKYRKAQAE